MSMLFRQSEPGPGQPLFPARTPVGSVQITADSALRHSTVWACLGLRADLVSTLPLNVFRKVGGFQTTVPTPPVLITPGGPRVRYMEWMYSSQMDLDRYGNDFGLIRERDGLGFPSRIDLVSAGSVIVRMDKKGKLDYKIDGKVYQPIDVWHEKQYTVPGLPIGMSPISYAAMSIGQYLSAQQFAVDWYQHNAMPAAHLKNTLLKTIQPEAAQVIKDRFLSSMSMGGVFVSGNDWEFSPVTAQAHDQEFLASMSASGEDICRFMRVPADMVDVAKPGGSVTYANITQRNLQLLVMNMGPVIARREEAMSFGLLPAPRKVVLNGDALLRMDPETRSKMLGEQIITRQIAPSEARELDNRAPFTDEQVHEFDRLFQNRRITLTGQAPPEEIV